ncbi:MAG TPA: PilZ domain-containing protein [Spongiibacteraceae bacterium]|jgi:hypothetical protein|nr:PilZ domain-containing protein [Spongiibacteraceae bacterium]HUH37807.1 PilZ domain-containing protein [Spongiibacteraceae bacterium]
MQERRRFFRVTDSVGVALQPIGDAEAQALAERIQGGLAGLDYVSHFDNRIHALLDALKLQNPVAAELLDLLNKKLDCVIAQADIDVEQLRQVAYNLREVNISACGVALACDPPLAVGQHLQMELVLNPSQAQLTVLGLVVASDSHAQGCFCRIDFVAISNADQELLIQHVVRRQSKVLKQRQS